MSDRDLDDEVDDEVAEIKQLRARVAELEADRKMYYEYGKKQLAEVERLRALVYAQNEVIKAVRSLRQRGGENPSRGTWPALHEVFELFDALDALDAATRPAAKSDA